MMTALVLGFVGSLHCIGMCGPLYMTFIGRTKRFAPFAIYHSGRLIAYLIVGGVASSVGSFVYLVGAQKVITIAMGIGLILLYLVPAIGMRFEKFYYQSVMSHRIRKLFTNGIRGRQRWLLSGFANGLLPCGLTFVAIASSIVLTDPYQGMIFMTLFGLGTLPAMVLIALLPKVPIRALNHLIPKAVPVMAIASGFILVYRGLSASYQDMELLLREQAALLISVCGI